MEKGQLRVWWIPQVPLKSGEESFFVNVKDTDEAKLMLNTLADYDLYQYNNINNNIKPDYSNASGLQICTGEDWVEWEDYNGDDINETIEKEEDEEEEF